MKMSGDVQLAGLMTKKCEIKILTHFVFDKIVKSRSELTSSKFLTSGSLGTATK